MTEIVWTPKPGEQVKMTMSKVRGSSAGLPVLILLKTVDTVTRAGFVRLLSDRYGDSKFERVEPFKFKQWQPRRLGGMYITVIEPASAEEIRTLPATMAEGRDYVRKVVEKMKLVEAPKR
jgi:hypothetical protein